MYHLMIDDKWRHCINNCFRSEQIRSDRNVSPDECERGRIAGRVCVRHDVYTVTLAVG